MNATLPIQPATPPIPTEWLQHDAPPLEVDFGCHRGTFFIGMAALHPSSNFLGIEKQADRVSKCSARITRQGLPNAIARQGTGCEALRELLPDQSVSVFHLYFPDPWPKRRHAARRVFQSDFLQQIRRVLRPDGILRLMTDDEPYFLEMRELTSVGWVHKPWDDGREPVHTAFEKTFLSMGQLPHRAALSAG